MLTSAIPNIPAPLDCQRNIETREIYLLLCGGVLEKTLEKCIIYTSSEDNFQQVYVKKEEEYNKASLSDKYKNQHISEPAYTNTLYIHLKTERVYLFMLEGIYLDGHIKQLVAIYMGISPDDSKVWVRDLSEFKDGRFAQLVFTPISTEQ